MTEAQARTALSAIIAKLRQANPDWEGIILTVRNLATEVGRSNLFKQEESGGPSQRSKQEPSEVGMELEYLEAALSAKDVSKAVEHAEAALQMLDWIIFMLKDNIRLCDVCGDIIPKGQRYAVTFVRKEKVLLAESAFAELHTTPHCLV
jgi:hypothetical protein